MISEQITLLNNTTLESFDEADKFVILANFTKVAIKILKADFGFTWWKEEEKSNYKLVFKSPETPYTPNPPRKRGGNFLVQKTKNPLFITNVKSQKYQKRYDVSPYMASYVIIPIYFKNNNYGNVVICFKNTRIFSFDEQTLCKSIGNALAQAITIHSLYFSLRDFKNRLDRTLDSVLIFDPVNFKIEYANLGAVKFLGFNYHSEILKKTIFNLLPENRWQELRSAIGSLIFKKRVSLVLETVFINQQGKGIPVELFLQISGTPEGPRKFLSIVRDITQTKKLEEESRRLLKQKDEFLSIASHELKTPVTTIKGFSQLLEEMLPQENVKAKEYLGKISFQVDRLTRLVNDLLDVSRVETGKLKLRRRLFELSDLVKDTVSDLQLGITSHELVLKAESKFWIYGDPDRISQVIGNLVNNAVKYSPGKKKVKITLGKEKHFAEVRVEDFGIGIDVKKQRKIFDKLFQLQPKGDTAFPGLGLGLYISSNIIKLHKGSISCKSKKTRGSIFCFTLPYRK